MENSRDLTDAELSSIRDEIEEVFRIRKLSFKNMIVLLEVIKFDLIYELEWKHLSRIDRAMDSEIEKGLV
jgi:hypothetical protein